MATKCCGASLKLRGEKLKVVVGTTAAVAAAGAMLGTPIGWLGLLAAASSPNVGKMIQFKARAWQASDQAGTYFECETCGRQIGLGEAVGF